MTKEGLDTAGATVVRLDRETKEPPQEQVVQTLPLLGSPLSIGVLVLATLATVYALYVGKEVVLPIMLALVFKHDRENNLFSDVERIDRSQRSEHQNAN